MANSKQALKRVRQAEKRRQNNKWQHTRMSTALKQVLSAIKAGNQEQAQAAYQTATSLVDRLAGKGIIHRNKASRHKSRLIKQITAMKEAS